VCCFPFPPIANLPAERLNLYREKPSSEPSHPRHARCTLKGVAPAGAAREGEPVADSGSWPALDSLLGDRYTREARIAPAFLCVFPILILLMAWFKGLQDAVPALLSLLCVFGVVRWISHIARGIGDQVEIELFEKWGGKPTTTMLRVALNCVKVDELHLFDKDPPGGPEAGSSAEFRRRARFFLKVRHLLLESPHGDKMKELIAARMGPKFPEMKDDREIADSEQPYAVQAYLLDSLYEPVVAWMRENLRGSKLVAEEEISYGFQRNLFALKSFALLSNGAAFLIQAGVISYVYWRHRTWAMTPSIAVVILAANLLYLAGVLKFVSRDDVMVQGFIYARQLFDALYVSDSAATKDGVANDDDAANNDADGNGAHAGKAAKKPAAAKPHKEHAAKHAE